MRLTRLAAILALVAALAAPAAGAAERLIIVSPHQLSIKNEYGRAFSEWYASQTGQAVEVEWLDVGGTSDILKYLQAEYARQPDGVGIDIMWGGGVDPYLELADNGLLQAYKLPDDQLSLIPAELFGVPIYDPQYRWYGSALSGFGIIYNKEVLRRLGLPEPRTWADLADPAYRNWVGTIDLRHSGVGHAAVEIIMQALGWEKGYATIARMAGNTRTFTRSSSDVPRAVAAGDLALGASIDFYAWAQVAQYGSDRIGFVLPDGLTVINPDSIAILKGAPHLALAQAFLRFVLSEAGQKLWLLPAGAPGGPREETLGRMAVLPEAYETAGTASVVPINPFALNNLLSYDAEKGSERYALLNDLVGATLIDPHDVVQATWSAIVDAGMDPEALAAYDRVPISESEAMEMTDRWNDQGFRNRRIAEWSAWAVRRLSEARALAR
ncbi:MAG TPA: extracellular solute-binding protein [Limnochordia bacterium]